ncbi:MAG TPA: hypothetical protein VLV49_08960 [Terriglobales bacterium]|nr:hypothetical protein [Terriglobales bacterium]
MLKRGLSLAFIFLFAFAASAPWASSENGQEEGRIPAYHAGPPPRGVRLPALLTEDQLWGASAQYPFQTHAYKLAAKIPAVIYQQPCFCYCDRMGHKSLHSCFEDVHGAQCATCLKELYYAYLEHKKGRTAKQIRAGIISGQWKQIDLQTAASIE